MCPVEADRTYLIYCHYLEMASSPPSRLLNRTLFASESAMKMLALPCRCQNHCSVKQTLLVAVEVSESTSVTLSQTKMLDREQFKPRQEFETNQQVYIYQNREG